MVCGVVSPLERGLKGCVTVRCAAWDEMIFAVVWRGGVSCVWVVALDVGGCVTSVHSLLKSKTVSETEQKTPPSTVSRES